MDKPAASKIAIAIVVLILALIVGVYWYYWRQTKKAEEKTPAQTITESAVRGTLPSINPQSNPLEKLPEINPLDKTNPFKGFKTNPFE